MTGKASTTVPTCCGRGESAISRGLAWRASLECIQTAEWHGFANIEELFEFLRGEVQSSPELGNGPTKH